MNGPFDFSDIEEDGGRGATVLRDASGRIIRKDPGPIARTILNQLGRRGMTRYELWRGARERCPTLSKSAVYEFLRGERDIGTRYLEPLMAVAGLTIVAPDIP